MSREEKQDCVKKKTRRIVIWDYSFVFHLYNKGFVYESLVTQTLFISLVFLSSKLVNHVFLFCNNLFP